MKNHTVTVLAICIGLYFGFLIGSTFNAHEMRKEAKEVGVAYHEPINGYFTWRTNLEYKVKWPN